MEAEAETGERVRAHGLAALFVGRPILALVLNLLVVIAGLAALNFVEIRELPNVDRPKISVRVSYPGASPPTIDAEVTSILEAALAQLEGVESISSESTYERSAINLELKASANLAEASNEARELVASTMRELPEGIEEPRVRKDNADADPVVRLALTGDVPLADLTSLAKGPVLERLSGVEDVAEVEIHGEQQRIIRVTFYPVQLASRGLSLTDLRNALVSANLDRPLGSLQTATQSLIVRSVASATTAEAISRIRLNRNTVVSDVAFVQMTSDEPNAISRVNGQPAVGINIIRQSLGNTLSVSRDIRQAVAEIQGLLPQGVSLIVAADDGVFIQRSIDGVVTSIFLAIAIVIVVIFLFLRSLRAVAVPAVTVPIALVGSIAAVWLSGFSINTITLLALVLATGMVVDDAIVVLENIVRKRREGMPAFAAAAAGTREVFFAVISTTATLAAVFIPISFLPGQAGGIFAEFGFVLAFSVTLSSFTALTLCPALCAFLDPGGGGDRAGDGAGDEENGRRGRFDRAVAGMLRWRYALLGAAALFAGGAFALYDGLPKEITPTEDRGLISISVRAPVSASLEYTALQTAAVEQALLPYVESGDIPVVQSRIGRRGSNNLARVHARLALWEDRTRTQQEIMSALRKSLRDIPGAKVSLRSSNSLGIRGGGKGIDFAVAGTNYDRLADLASALVERMEGDPTFASPELAYETNQPQLSLDINRELAADLGLSPAELIATLHAVIEGESTANLFLDNETVEVKLEVGGRRVDDQTDLENVFVRTSEGNFVPVSAIVSLSETAGAATLSREGRQPVVSAEANLGSGVDLGTAAARLAEIAPAVLAPDGRLVLLGEAATLDESRAGNFIVFAAAILIVFFVLAAQFESFASALIIIITVPFGLGAALIAIYLSGGSLNYYSQIGLVMLVGIMAKNGILIVEFANQLRERGHDVDSAIRNAMTLRLRPVMMTMVSTVCGGVPLVLATGAGAEARSAVGWVVVGGLGFATVFTLFLTPVLYRIIAPLSPLTGAAQRRLETELAESGAA